MEDITTIVQATTKFRDDTQWKVLKKRWESDFDLWRVKRYTAGKGYYSYTSNMARVSADKLIAMINASHLIISLFAEYMDKKERDKANAAERLLYGLLSANDERILRMGFPPLRRQMGWLGTIRGSFFINPYMYKAGEDKTVAQIPVWDPYAVSYCPGVDGLAWATHIRKAPVSQIVLEYPELEKELPTSDPFRVYDVYDHWDTKTNSVIVNNLWAKEPMDHGLDFCPVHQIVVGSMPEIWHEHYKNTGALIGESIFGATRHIFPIISKILSDYATIVRRGVKVPLAVKSADGSLEIQEDIWQVEQGGQLSMRLEDKVEPIITPTMPADAGPLLAAISGEIQRALFPHVALGELNFRLSGYAIKELQDAIITLIFPFVDAIELAYRITAKTLMTQYSTGNYPRVKVSGKDSKGQTFGIPKALEITPSDIDPEWTPRVEIVPELPKDAEKDMYLAKLATDGPDPLISKFTARETMLHLQDPELEQARINYEFSGNLHMVKLFNAYKAAVDDGRDDEAQNILMEVRMVLGAAGGPIPGKQPTPPKLNPAGSPKTGVPNTVMPPEAVGLTPPGAQNAGLPNEAR